MQTCGKFILTGEHFILHGTSALAMPWTQATLQLHPDPSSHNRSPHLLNTWNAACRHFSLPTAENFPFSIESSIPQGCGFGSSAALCVALATEAASRAGQQWEERALIQFATDLEYAFHGRSSGLDPTIVVKRQPLRVHMDGTQLPFTWSLRGCGFVLAVSQEERQTAEAVHLVSQYAQQHPKPFDAIVQEMHSIVASVEGLITGEGSFGRLSTTERGEQLGQQLTRNHQLLHTVGVSSPHLEELVETALQHGAWGAKLTGAGMGGGMFALAPLSRLPALSNALTAANAKECAIFDPNALDC